MTRGMFHIEAQSVWYTYAALLGWDLNIYRIFEMKLKP